MNLKREAFHYNPKIDYCADKSVTIREMTIICQHCKTLKYIGESTGLYCAGGKVKLSQLVPPQNPLHSLVYGMESDDKHFLTIIQKHNSCFQIISFGAKHNVHENCMPLFMV